MIDDTLVIDGVGHAQDFSDGNLLDGVPKEVIEGFRRFGYGIFVGQLESREPGYRLTLDEWANTRFTAEDLAHTFFVESDVDMVVGHHVEVNSLFKNGMGLLRQIQAEPEPEGWSITMQLRLTSPGCLYFFAFKDNLEERLSAHPQISRVVVDWDQSLDWTPEDLTPAARSRLDERRRTLWQPSGR